MDFYGVESLSMMSSSSSSYREQSSHGVQPGQPFIQARAACIANEAAMSQCTSQFTSQARSPWRQTRSLAAARSNQLRSTTSLNSNYTELTLARIQVALQPCLCTSYEWTGVCAQGCYNNNNNESWACSPNDSAHFSQARAP